MFFFSDCTESECFLEMGLDIKGYVFSSEEGWRRVCPSSSLSQLCPPTLPED